MRIWNDCSGGVFTTELILVTSMVVAGVATGLANYRNAIQSELADLASGVQSINQSFAFTGIRGPNKRTAGSQYVDYRDIEVIRPTCIQYAEFE